MLRRREVLRREALHQHHHRFLLDPLLGSHGLDFLLDLMEDEEPRSGAALSGRR